MSDIVRKNGSHAVYGGVSVDIAEEGLDRVIQLLAGLRGGAYKAMGSALAQAANSGKTVAKREASKKYTISQSEFVAQTKNINHFVHSGRALSVVFGYRGHVVPLIKFDTKFGADGRVHTCVLRSSAQEVLDHAFVARMGGHTGVFEREGPERFPVRELYGPATPQMMYSDEETMDKIENRIVETYTKRISHEIDVILNGWRR